MIRRTLLTLVLTLATVTQAAPPSLPEIDRYRGLLHFLQVSETPQSMQPLFDAAESVQSAVMRIDDSGYAWLERVSDDDAVAIQAQLEGLRLHRGLDVYAELDTTVMHDLALQHGRPVDQAFFAGLKDAYNDQGCRCTWISPTGLHLACVLTRPRCSSTSTRTGRSLRRRIQARTANSWASGYATSKT